MNITDYARIAHERISHIEGHEVVDCIMFRGQLLACCVDGAAFLLDRGEWRRLALEPVTPQGTADVLPFKKP